jgi:multiple sugar transport system permease protein
MLKRGFVERTLKILFPLPAVLFVALMMVFPVLFNLAVSFTNWNLTLAQKPRFVFFQSYMRVLREPRFFEALGRTFLFTLGALFFETILGIILALFLNRSFRGKSFIKLLLLLPLVATPVALGIVWNLIYDPTIGFANYLLNLFNLPPSLWVFSESSVLFSLIIVDVWQWTPMIALIVLAGLAGLPLEPFESAQVDGASRMQILFYITLPMVMPVILTAMILRSIDALKTFDIIFAMTKGGPGYASETLNILGYVYSFEYFKFGQASVILLLLFLLVFFCSIQIMKFRNRFEL